MAIETMREMVYTTHRGTPLHMDLHKPAGATGLLPVILWLPGGGWRNSRRCEGPFWAAEHGFAIASINYRVTPGATAPANIHDCKAAVRFLRDNTQWLGVDPARIGVWGSSAGGHLAAMVALSAGVSELEGDGVAQPAAVRAACDYCGPSELTRCAKPVNREKFPALYEVTEAYLAGPVLERRELARLVSPRTYARRDAPPMLIVHGKKDDIVPFEESAILYEALRDAGAPARLTLLPEANHSLHLHGPHEDVIAFFRETLRA
ncbi:MAG: alpha/beta hydrolase [Planctomycetes bacterium]|nr:alpha/beta hydrolase [Planctomycetota bacterium]